MSEETEDYNGKNEVSKFIAKYNIKYLIDNGLLKNFIVSNNPQNSVNSLAKILMKCRGFDRPDGYFYDEKTSTLYIFEHFEFDCSANIEHGGSTLRINSNKVGDAINKELSNAQSDYSGVKVIEQGLGVQNGNTITYYMGDNGDIYRNNYIKNFNTGYAGHSAKLQKYIDNCIKEISVTPNKIITTFLIEDVTMAGTYYNNNKNMGEPVNLILTKQFLEAFKSSNIDYVFFGYSEGISICDRSIANDNSSKYIDLLEKELYIIPAMPKFTYATKIDLS